MSLGYTKKEAIKLTAVMPSILSLSTKNIKQKLDDIMSLGYSKEKTLKIILELPSIFGLSFENISNKINYYREIGIDFYATEYPKNLIQSVELSYARYEYFKSNNIEINNYGYIFYCERYFKRQFGITKQELLQMYPYKNKEENLKDTR